MTKWQKLIIAITLIGAVVFVMEEKKRLYFTRAGGAYTLQDVNQTAQPVGAETPVQKPLPQLLDLGSDTCVPCRMMEPILRKLKTTYEGKLEVVFIDVGEHPSAKKQYGIRMIPTQIFYNAEGKELFRHEGFFAKEDILDKWKELGIKL